MKRLLVPADPHIEFREEHKGGAGVGLGGYKVGSGELGRVREYKGPASKAPDWARPSDPGR